MILYSKTISSFIKKIYSFAEDIFSNEINITLKKNKITFKDHIYFLSFVVFENKQNLGYYDPMTIQIGLHKLLMFQVDDKVIKDILRHEITHFLVHITYGINTSDHGTEFKEIFKRYQFNPLFSKSQIDLSQYKKEAIKSSALLKKNR